MISIREGAERLGRLISYKMIDRTNGPFQLTFFKYFFSFKICISQPFTRIDRRDVRLTSLGLMPLLLAGRINEHGGRKGLLTFLLPALYRCLTAACFDLVTCLRSIYYTTPNLPLRPLLSISCSLEMKEELDTVCVVQRKEEVVQQTNDSQQIEEGDGRTKGKEGAHTQG